jgi:hypothetical protein
MGDDVMRHEDEVGKGIEIERQLALEETKEWLEAHPKEEQEKLRMSVGGRTFSSKQILREIEESTPHGRLFAERLALQRLEKARRAEEIND